jgi:hypothetical protein
LFLFLVATGICLLLTGRWRRPDILLPLVLLTALTVDALRNGPLLVVGGVGEVALGLSVLRAPAIENRRAFAVLALAGWAAVTVPLARFAAEEAGKPRASDFPASAIRAIPPHCRLLNEYHHGGYIIWTRPDVPVSQDGRNDVYGTRLLGEELDVLEDKPTAAAARMRLDDWRVDCVLAFKSRPLASDLARSPGWRLVVNRNAGVLYERQPPR